MSLLHVVLAKRSALTLFVVIARMPCIACGASALVCMHKLVCVCVLACIHVSLAVLRLKAKLAFCTRVSKPPPNMSLDTFAWCRARIGAARLHLQPLSGALRDSSSAIQREAICDVVARGVPLNPDQSVTLCDMVMACNFTDACKTIILNNLHSSSSASKAGRRKQQNAMAFLSYVKGVEWGCVDAKKTAQDVRGVCNLFACILHNRMKCVNPSEPTIKLVTSASFVACLDEGALLSLPLVQKNGMKKFVRQKFDALCKKNAKNDATMLEYCMVYPEDPDELSASYPLLHKSIMDELGDDLGKCPLNSIMLTTMESSWQCRGTAKEMQNSTALVAANQLQPNAMQQQCMAMMQMMQQCMGGGGMGNGQGAQPRQSSDGLLENLIVNGNRKKRSAAMLRALMEAEDDDEGAFQTPPPKQHSLLNRARTFTDGLGLGAPAGSAAGHAALSSPEIAPVGQAPPSLGAAAIVAERVDQLNPGEVAQASTSAEDEAKKSDDLMEAMCQRDLERAAASAAASKAKKQAAKAEKAALAAQAKADADAKPTTEALPVKDVKTMVKPVPPATATPTKTTMIQPKSKPKTKATFSNEASRKQILCRTGLAGPGQSFAIKYGIDKKTGNAYGKTVEQAIAEAKKWVASKQ